MDTVRADRLAVYGGPAATPTLDGLARDAVVYERAYSHFPETGLSHWSMLTGVLPEVHGNVPATGDSAWRGPTAAELAKADGYATGAFIGGVTMTAASTGLDRGFDVYDDDFVVDPRDMKRPAADVVARAVEWIGGREEGWFAFVHLFDAHFPYTPADPRRYDADYAGAIDGSDAALGPYRDGAPLAERDVARVRALYDAELTELDAAIAPLLAAAPGAIVVVTADHGESFEHGYLFNHRGSLADGVLHVPWLLRAPGLAPGRAAEPVGLVDVLPTVATLVGWRVDAPIDGRPALPPVEARAEHWARTDPWLAGRVAGEAPGPLLALRTPAWKVVWAADGSARAWDLAADPAEERPKAVPAELAGARGRYGARLEGRGEWVRPVQGARGIDAGERGMLEALGYLAPGSPGSPGSANPVGSPAPGPGAPSTNPAGGPHGGSPGGLVGPVGPPPPPGGSVPPPPGVAAPGRSPSGASTPGATTPGAAAPGAAAPGPAAPGPAAPGAAARPPTPRPAGAPR